MLGLGLPFISSQTNDPNNPVWTKRVVHDNIYEPNIPIGLVDEKLIQNEKKLRI